MQLSLYNTFYYIPYLITKWRMRIPTGDLKSARKLQKLFTRSISKRFKGYFFFNVHRFTERDMFRGEHTVFLNSDESLMAVVSVTYEANQLCHAFDNDLLLSKITTHPLVMCHKAKYQTRSKTFTDNTLVTFKVNCHLHFH